MKWTTHFTLLIMWKNIRLGPWILIMIMKIYTLSHVIKTQWREQWLIAQCNGACFITFSWVNGNVFMCTRIILDFIISHDVFINDVALSQRDFVKYICSFLLPIFKMVQRQTYWIAGSARKFRSDYYSAIIIQRLNYIVHTVGKGSLNTPNYQYIIKLYVYNKSFETYVTAIIIYQWNIRKYMEVATWWLQRGPYQYK